jgi:glucose-1-phosphate adenylyltransferase
MRTMMGIVLTGGKKPRLKELSEIRSSAAIPIGGKYRAIDFVISNMVNSGIVNVGVLTQYSFRSLMDHLGSGKEWDLDRRANGLTVYPPYLSGENSDWYKGSADAMHTNLGLLRRSFEEYVVVAQGNCIYNMDYRKMMEHHVEFGADITVAYRDMHDYDDEDLADLGNLKLDENYRIIDFQEKPKQAKYRTCSLGIYFMKRELLISLLEEAVARGNYDFSKDVLAKKVETLKMSGYQFDGYWRNISTVQGYYKCNMELLNPMISKKLFEEDGTIYTRTHDDPPAKFNDEAQVKNSIIGDGCIIEGSVENSVIFRGVNIRKGAVVKNCIVMNSAMIDEGAKLEYMIIDKNAKISKTENLKGSSVWPVIVGKGAKI